MDREAKQYWASQRRKMLRRNRGGWAGDFSMTKILLTLMVVAYLVERFVPSLLFAVDRGPLGLALLLVLSALSPGSFIGLVFAGVFLWIIGSQLESLTRAWQYLVIFFASGIAGALLASLLGGGLVGGTFSSFGLAGAYVMAMANRRVAGMAQWAILLLAINVVLSGFHPGPLAGMLGAFLVGLGIARLARV